MERPGKDAEEAESSDERIRARLEDLGHERRLGIGRDFRAVDSGPRCDLGGRWDMACDHADQLADADVLKCAPYEDGDDAALARPLVHRLLDLLVGEGLAV